jgi:Nucleoporin autopeptidase
MLFCDFADCSIFRNEPESNDDSMPEPARPQKFAVIVPDDDEVAEGGYYTMPPMKKVASTASVSDFIVVRKGYGSISFKDVVDLTSITSLSVLREYVEIGRGRVTVYPNESTALPPGKGLNIPAEIVLEKSLPLPDVSVDEHIDNLKSQPDRKFVSYDTNTGAWTFQVDHFSTYTDADASYPTMANPVSNSSLKTATPSARDFKKFKKAFDKACMQFYHNRLVDPEVEDVVTKEEISMEVFDRLTLGRQLQRYTSFVDGRMRFEDIPNSPHGEVAGVVMSCLYEQLRATGPGAKFLVYAGSGMNSFFVN